VPTETSVQPNNVSVIPPLITSKEPLISEEPVIPDEVDTERCDDDDRELELEGLGHLSLTSIPAEDICDIDGSRKRRRTQAVSSPLIFSNLIIFIYPIARIIHYSFGYHTSIHTWRNSYN
jgi:hypothetical protein